ncbi:Chromosome partition protein Smc [Acaryochloris thomasi RCC1774]|uniref:Chromosome partition protein Smc n=1 Tax=Acaryochloris thomasi RCC1774 TaxID=1764569 RepID=A0A2W1K1G5_9CYAN|nr:Npun_F5560 family protein [Acaryochloris thomasi]PZD74341.1 Chromosome partition protein Smc [Acaryochloris thomasi RCC1774]
MMNQPQQDPTALEKELKHLRQQLSARDQLVDQLSSELFRLIQAHPPLLAPAAEVTTGPLSQVDRLRQELQAVEEQIEFYQQQIDDRDAEINRLQNSCQSLSERNQMLERLIQELPEVYKHQFSDRLDQVKNKMQSLQTENQRLYSQIQQESTEEQPGIARRLLPSFGGPKNSSTS